MGKAKAIFGHVKVQRGTSGALGLAREPRVEERLFERARVILEAAVEVRDSAKRGPDLLQPGVIVCALQ
jgi:hypothetical protein